MLGVFLLMLLSALATDKEASKATGTKDALCKEDPEIKETCADDAATKCFKVFKAKPTWADCLTECEKTKTAPWCCHYHKDHDCTVFRGVKDMSLFKDMEESKRKMLKKVGEFTAAVKQKRAESSVGDEASTSKDGKGFVCNDSGKDKACPDDKASNCFVDLSPKLSEKKWASCKAECEKTKEGKWCCHEYVGDKEYKCTLVKGGEQTQDMSAVPDVKDKVQALVKTAEMQVKAPVESDLCWGWQAVAFVAFASSLGTYTITKHMQERKYGVSVALLEGEDEL